MPRPAELRRTRLLRFTRGERWVHRATAALMLVCLVTAAMLYVGALATLVGRRALVEWVHVIAGCALPLPTLLGLASSAFRRDLRRLNRFTPTDWKWLRAPGRRSGRLLVGKFNAGQKLNASFVAGAAVIMLGSGLVMRFANAWPVRWRSGATFVHDWVAFAILVVVVGHTWMALRDPDALAGMRTGWVPMSWARREHGAWAQHETTSTDERAAP